MARGRRWDPCIAHRGDEVEAFIAEYFGARERRVLFIGGAGFDPRSTAVAKQLAAAGTPIRAVFFQEDRPRPARGLVDRATTNAGVMTTAITDHELVPVEIFGPDGASDRRSQRCERARPAVL